MNTPLTLAVVTAVGLTLSIPIATLGASWTVDLEAGPVMSGYNNIRIPNETGTKISLTDDLNTDVEPYWRLRTSMSFGKHTVSALLAPLRIDAAGSVNEQVLFEGTKFPAGTPLDAEYTFNSYRLTWRYAILKRDNWRMGIGFTGKLRDAAVLIRSSESVAEKTNVGFVPLINFLLSADLSSRLHLTLEGDALAAPQGRAEDVALLLNYRAGHRLSIKAGYRLLEGGADVDEVYSFALLHYGVFGVTLHL